MWKSFLMAFLVVSKNILTFANKIQIISLMETLMEDVVPQVNIAHDLTVEEAYEMVCKDLKAIYNIKDAV